MRRSRLAAAAALCASLFALAAPAAAALTVTQFSDVAAGIAAFGPADPLLTWVNLYPAGATWTAGALPPSLGGATQTDPATGAQVSGALNIANWWDGTGFDRPGGGPGPDLALNGIETFSFTFAAPVSRIGFAVSTGLSNVSQPPQVDNAGATFSLAASGGQTGGFTLVDPGRGAVAWISISSPTPFTTLSFVETSANDRDQYFGNLVSADAAAIPEPASWALVIAGFGLAGGALRRRRAAA
jgi:hypothetical protein